MRRWHYHSLSLTQARNSGPREMKRRPYSTVVRPEFFSVYQKEGITARSQEHTLLSFAIFNKKAPVVKFPGSPNSDHHQVASSCQGVGPEHKLGMA